MGPSGSGKSTLCNLIARFYDANSGTITIGGTDIRKFTCDSLLKNISMVFQNVYLFRDTIKNNIKFGSPDATDEQIIAAAKAARCHDFIMALPDGYDTVIGEGGSSLSGGEKQRISIARAMLKDAPIVILDEATASIDPENEHLIQEAISALTHGKTIITIAHRLATIENADQILVIDGGTVAQRGTHTGTFLPPSNQTIAEFLLDFVSLYGEKKWGVSMYDSQNSLIANYINPIIGDMKVQDVTPRVVDKYIQPLQKTPAVNTRTHHAKTDLVTNATIEKIIKLLRCAFKQAVRWELIAKNPFDNVVLPKTEYKKRDIWTADMIRTALDQCTDSKLYVAMNLSFACSLRMGEILGLTWNNVHISDDDIADDNAYVFIDKELARASKRAIEMLGQKDVYHIFTPLFPNTSTRVILKKPKTDSSIRKVWLPKTLAYILREWKKAQDELRGFLGDEYQDYDLVVALPNGRPCEDRIILKEFEKLREKAGLPRVVFHSLRHSSTTYKLKLNHGDLKATQGDTGHAEIDMITSVYAHILDEDRKINAQKFESAFYANPNLRAVHPPEEPAEQAPAKLDLEALVEQLRQSPELANTLAALLSAAPGGR